jgi:dTDP-4-dehydrorhamnose reductase
LKALIVGAGGQVGRALIETAPAEAELVAVDIPELDITEASAVAEVVRRTGPQVIFNASGYTAVDRAETESEAAFAINRDGVGHLAAAADRHGARLVHLSTDFVFDGASSRPYRPDDLPAPLSVYGASKLAGETAALAASGALVVRTAWVHAPEGQNFVLTMLRLFCERPEVGVVADQVGAPTAAKSLASALWGLTARGASGLHHFTDAGVASWYDFAVAICEEGAALGLCPATTRINPVRTEDYPTAARRPAYSLLDKSATWALLGEPARHWREELRVTLGRIKDSRHD